MKTLLVAVLPEDCNQVPGIAADEYKVYIAASIREATTLLRSVAVDGIVCGVHFNDGDLFEFLATVKSNPVTASLPFIVVKGAEGRLQAGSYKAVGMACEEKGIPYLDATELVKRLGAKEGYAQLRSIIRGQLA